MTTKPRIRYTSSITVKCTPHFKKEMEAMAWEKGDGISRLVRKSVEKTHPQVREPSRINGIHGKEQKNGS
jgi:hypothetical protein